MSGKLKTALREQGGYLRTVRAGVCLPLNLVNSVTYIPENQIGFQDF